MSNVDDYHSIKSEAQSLKVLAASIADDLGAIVSSRDFDEAYKMAWHPGTTMPMLGSLRVALESARRAADALRYK